VGGWEECFRRGAVFEAKAGCQIRSPDHHQLTCDAPPPADSATPSAGAPPAASAATGRKLASSSATGCGWVYSGHRLGLDAEEAAEAEEGDRQLTLAVINH